jgi:C4-dicarboxylate-specific signal transduction histidine kinase
MRATVEHSKKIGRKDLPDIEIDICQGADEIIVRFRDQGGGIPADG